MCILTISLLTGTATAVSIGAAAGAGAAAASAVGTGLVAAEIGGIVSSVAGGIVSTVSGVVQAKQQQAAAEAQASIAEENSRLAARNAEETEVQANQKRLALYNQMRQTQGNVRTDFAGRGVVLGSGTANDYEADLADAYDMDRRNLEYDAASQKWRSKVQAANFSQQAGLLRTQADSLGSQAAGSIFSGTLSTAGNTAASGFSSFGMASELGLLKKKPIEGAFGSNQKGSAGNILGL